MLLRGSYGLWRGVATFVVISLLEEPSVACGSSRWIAVERFKSTGWQILSTAVVRLLVVLTGDVCLPIWSASIVSNVE